MNYKLLAILIVLVVTVGILAACVPVSAPSSANCQEGICVDVQLAEPIHFNQSVTVTITVESDQDIPGLGVTLGDFNPYVPTEGTRAWDVDTKAHQPVSFTGTVRFTHEGYFDVIGAAITQEGRRVVDSVPVYISRAGGTVNPPVPTGPAQAVPYTPSPSESPLPTPSPRANSLLTPSAGQWYW
jgi:hypothetical protein